MARRRFSISAGQFDTTWPSTHETISARVSVGGEITPPTLAGVAGVVAVPSGAEAFLHPAPIRQATAAIDTSRYKSSWTYDPPTATTGHTAENVCGGRSERRH